MATCGLWLQINNRLAERCHPVSLPPAAGASQLLCGQPSAGRLTSPPLPTRCSSAGSLSFILLATQSTLPSENSLPVSCHTLCLRFQEDGSSMQFTTDAPAHAAHHARRCSCHLAWHNADTDEKASGHNLRVLGTSLQLGGPAPARGPSAQAHGAAALPPAG